MLCPLPSQGVRQPGAVVGWDNAVYLFWIDNGFHAADVWAARSAPGPNQGTPGSFFIHNHQTSAWDIPTLPPGYAAGTFMASLRQRAPAGMPGAPASPVFPLAPAAGSVHFTAARLTAAGKPTPYHLAVYSVVNYTQCAPPAPAPGQNRENSTGNRIEGVGTLTLREVLSARARSQNAGTASDALAGQGSALPAAERQGACSPLASIVLRVTEDFVTFSSPTTIAQYDSTYPLAMLQYPMLLNENGKDQDAVDAGGFYIMGTCSNPDAPCGSSYGPQVTLAKVSIALE